MNRVTVAAGLLAIAAIGSSVTVAVVSDSSIARLERQAHSQHSEITSLRTQLTGSRPDVITCGDLQSFLRNLSLQVDVSDAYGDSMSGSAWDSSVQLPSHCINQ